MFLEWKTQTAYALTELVTLATTCLVVLATVGIALTVFFVYFKTESSFLSVLRPLFANVLTTAIAFSPELSGNVKTINIVFLGYKEQRNVFSGSKNNKLVRIWVHVYFTSLCSIIVVWALSIFSNTLLYRKTSSCRDLSVKDTDTTCFLLSTRDVPEGVAQIIENNEGLVPCKKVQDYLLFANFTYDLEVICYQSQLNPLAALGIAYGTMKSITFVIITLLSVLLSITTKLSKKRSKICFLIFQIVLSVLVIISTIIVTSTLHEVIGPRNSAMDYLRGEQFYHCSVIVLIALTVVFTLGTFPWWAFKLLEIPPALDSKTLLEDQEQLFGLINLMVLHHTFSTGIATLIEVVADGVVDAVDAIEDAVEEGISTGFGLLHGKEEEEDDKEDKKEDGEEDEEEVDQNTPLLND